MVNVFEYTDYKVYLRALIKRSDVRGFSSRLAEAAGCQKSYLSSSLKGKSHLLPDHIYGIGILLKLQSDEQDYFNLILDYQRATNPEYRKFVFRKIQLRQSEWKDLKNRLQQKSLTKTENNDPFDDYYSNYLYTALNIAVSIPQLQNLKALSAYFVLPEQILITYLNRLESMGLVEKSGLNWIWKSGNSHLSRNSPWIQNHHCNWRMQALADIPLRKTDSLHYSIVQSISREDLERLRFQMVQWIEEFGRTATPSQPEELICFNLDFFGLSKT